MANNILVVNGPNLNLLGSREPDRYGTATLEAIEQRLWRAGAVRPASSVTCFPEQFRNRSWSSASSRRPEGVDFILINPAAYTHTSVAMRDALAAVAIPFVEIHLSNIHAREPFRQRSYFSDLAVGVISGLGAKGYELALAYALEHAAKV